ncbi:hypothetical protein NE237_027191 [Protea cynaroides]|uniref:Uncharacterized protein n=1 Tax=Protea cynaroides TaxID=273540 RepID=A0A9Q0JRN7_9MAGN|nr:hypothetical protein NE237_027191 [Protea cynaroides]
MNMDPPSCPLQNPRITQKRGMNSSTALGLRFLQIEEEEKMIQEWEGLNIRFSWMNDTIWQVEDRRQQSSRLRDLTRYGEETPGHPMVSTVTNQFKIERMSKGKPQLYARLLPQCVLVLPCGL